MERPSWGGIHLRKAGEERIVQGDAEIWSSRRLPKVLGTVGLICDFRIKRVVAGQLRCGVVQRPGQASGASGRAGSGDKLSSTLSTAVP